MRRCFLPGLLKRWRLPFQKPHSHVGVVALDALGNFQKLLPCPVRYFAWRMSCGKHCAELNTGQAWCQSNRPASISAGLVVSMIFLIGDTQKGITPL